VGSILILPSLEQHADIHEHSKTAILKGTIRRQIKLVIRRQHMIPRDFDLFEKFSNGSSVWRTCASGQIDAQQKLQHLADHSENEFYSIDIETGELQPFKLARSNSSKELKRAASS
jgi:hypothetical protein